MSTRQAAGFSKARATAGNSRGFTLIELMVVIAIIALLVSILLPSLRSAREHAKEVVCGANLAGLGRGLANYTYVSKDWLPGVNTSGVAIRTKKSSPEEAMQSGTLPVQSFDWLTPLVISDTELPDDRAQRYKLLLDTYRCPSLESVPSILYSGSMSVPDIDRFREVQRWSATSYLMPVYFQYWGDNHTQTVLGQLETFGNLKVRAKAAPDNYKEVRNENYRSRVDEIGSPADKVFVADGTRYLDENGILDHDIDPDPTHYGNFTANSAWQRLDTAYGVAKDSANWDGAVSSVGSVSDGRNLTLTYRHSKIGDPKGKAIKNKGLINALFFDGHVELQADQRSRRIQQWYPKNSIVKSQNPAQEGMTSIEAGYVIP